MLIGHERGTQRHRERACRNAQDDDADGCFLIWRMLALKRFE